MRSSVRWRFSHQVIILQFECMFSLFRRCSPNSSHIKGKWKWKMKNLTIHWHWRIAWVFHIKIHQIRIEFEWASLLLIYRLVFWLLSFRDVFMSLSSFVIFFLQFGVALGWRMGRRFRFRECWPIGTLASVPTWWNIG